MRVRNGFRKTNRTESTIQAGKPPSNSAHDTVHIVLSKRAKVGYRIRSSKFGSGQIPDGISFATTAYSSISSNENLQFQLPQSVKHLNLSCLFSYYFITATFSI